MTPNVDPITFFNKANELMVKNSPAAADKEMLEKIAAVNIGPGMEYAYRALVALAGLGANTVEVALYPKIEQDADGNTLLNFL